VEHDFVRRLWRVVSIAFTPIIADCICKNVAIAVECCARDGTANGWVALQTMLCVLVPEVEGPITARSAEGPVDRVERDCIHSVDVADITGIGGRLAMAFEAKVRTGVFILHVLNSTATLNTANSKPGGVCEAANNPSLEL